MQTNKKQTEVYVDIASLLTGEDEHTNGSGGVERALLLQELGLHVVDGGGEATLFLESRSDLRIDVTRHGDDIVDDLLEVILGVVMGLKTRKSINRIL